MDTQRILTPHEAQALLGAAEHGRRGGDDAGNRARLAAFASILIGVLVGAFLLAGVFVLPVATPLTAALVSGGYVVGILVATTTYNLLRKVRPAGWIRRYLVGLAITIGVFAAALALSFLIEERSMWLWVPLAVLASLPVSVLGSWKQRA